MKRCLVVRIAQNILLQSVFVSGVSIACGDMPIFSTQGEDGVRYGLFISDAKFDEMHGWQPGDGEPPAPIAEAVAKSEEWERDHFRKYDGVEVSGITLQWTRCSGGPPKWYYLIEVSPIFDSHTVRSAARSVAVFMDASVVALKEVD